VFLQVLGVVPTMFDTRWPGTQDDQPLINEHHEIELNEILRQNILTNLPLQPPDHHAYLEQMKEECRDRGVPVFPPVPRRHSYLSLSVAGQDYRPVPSAIAGLLAERMEPVHA